jgi:hypothetical protein
MAKTKNFNQKTFAMQQQNFPLQLSFSLATVFIVSVGKKFDFAVNLHCRVLSCHKSIANCHWFMIISSVKRRWKQKSHCESRKLFSRLCSENLDDLHTDRQKKVHKHHSNQLPWECNKIMADLWSLTMQFLFNFCLSRNDFRLCVTSDPSIRHLRSKLFSCSLCP